MRRTDFIEETAERRGRVPVRRHENLALAAASLGFAIVQLDVSVVNVAVRSIGADLGGGITGLQWVVDAYTVVFAALMLTAGALGDRYGARRMLLLGFGAFTLASAACGLAPSIGALIAFRAVQGIGAAALGACSLALLSLAFPAGPERVRALGVWAVSGSVAMAAGPLAGGALIAAAGWRAIFFINLPVGAAGIWFTARSPGQRPEASGGMDLPGQVTAAAALAAVAGATIEAGSQGFTTLVLAGYAIAAVAGAAFVLIERRSARPMLPLPLFRNGAFSAAVSLGCVLNIAAYGLLFVFSLFLQRGEGLPTLATGAAFLPAMAAVMAGNTVSARMLRTRAPQSLIVRGGLVMGAACAALWLMALWLPVLRTSASGTPGRSAVAVAVLMAGLTAVTFGVGLIVPAMTAAVLGTADSARAGVASGTLTAFRQSGSVLGVAVFGAFSGAGLAVGLRASLLSALLLAAAIAALSRLTGRVGNPVGGETAEVRRASSGSPAG
jgi:DHA2 family methylenomycin A resistance protein-like MFS transporter